MRMTVPAVWLGVAALVLGAAPARATEARVAVVVGFTRGLESEEPLRYAGEDARRFRDVLVDLGGVSPDHALLVQGGGRTAVFEAIATSAATIRALAQTGRTVTLIFYFSGHGDEASLHLGPEQLPLTELRARLSAVPAQLHWTILDSCRSGEIQKGVRRGPDFTLDVVPAGPQGAVELRAAATGEPAQESDSLEGALFTHFLITGLRGEADVDRDGQVTLAELYSYAYRRTLLKSGSAVSPQHPSIREEFSGAGDWILTRTSGASAQLTLPPLTGGDYVVFALPSGSVVLEATGGQGGPLALPSGRYLVQRRKGSHHGVAEVDPGRCLNEGPAVVGA